MWSQFGGVAAVQQSGCCTDAYVLHISYIHERQQGSFMLSACKRAMLLVSTTQYLLYPVNVIACIICRTIKVFRTARNG